MDLSYHLQKDNLHHAYLIEGVRANILPDLIAHLETLGIHKEGNPDFYELSYGSLKMADASYLRSFTDKKSIIDGKKIFLISADAILTEAQNTLLKLFEEPIPNTHFLIVVPDTNALLETFVSRFYTIKGGENNKEEFIRAKNFLVMNRVERISFIQELLTGEEDEEDDAEDGAISQTSTKNAKAQAFLNALEHELHEKFFSSKKSNTNLDFLDHLFKVRIYLRQPGSSAKTLLESLALSIPEKI